MSKPIVPELTPSPAPHADTKAEPIPRCVACGAVHGGIGEGRICLENEVRRLRGILSKLGRPLALLACAFFLHALCACGGARFGTALDEPRDAGDAIAPLAVDAPSNDPVAEAGAVIEAGSDAIDRPARDASPLEDAPELAPDAYVAPPPPPPDAGDLPDRYVAPAPPALCCLTPCSGSSPAAITCGNGGDWTCSAGACGAGACDVGASCTWMTVCTGHVEICP